MLLLLTTLACAPKSAAPATDLPAAEDVDWDRVMLQFHMGEHYSRMSKARDLVLAGQLDAARVELAWLADHETFPGEPEGVGHYLDDMRAVAATAASATDARGMAACIGGIGATCGGCHSSLGVQPNIPGATGPAPDDTGGARGHAAYYAWTADQLWIGLVQPSDDAWTRSLDAVVEGSIDVDGLGIAPEGREVVSAYVAILHDVSVEGEAHANPPTRSETFGEVVSACAGCHAAAR